MMRIKELIHDGRTLIFVSHGAETVAKICKRAIYLKAGALAYDGDTMSAIEEYYLDQYIDLKSLETVRSAARETQSL